jgi:hypothetical protein
MRWCRVFVTEGGWTKALFSLGGIVVTTSVASPPIAEQRIQFARLAKRDRFASTIA